MSTKSKTDGVKVCSQSALAASTPATPDLAPERPELPSLIFDSLRSPLLPRFAKLHGMRLTGRDVQIIELVYCSKALREDQIRIALFSEGGASRCQRRLTLLVRNRFLDRLPRRTVNEPAIYVLSRRSAAGNRLLRQKLGDKGFRL